MAKRTAGQEDLFSLASKAAGKSFFGMSVQMDYSKGGYQILLRMLSEDLIDLVSASPHADLSRIGRHVASTATAEGSKVIVNISFDRPRLGEQMIRYLNDRQDEVILGPILFIPTKDQERLLHDYRRQGVMPLTWSDLSTKASGSVLELPNILSMRALIGDGEAILMPGALDAMRRSIHNRKQRERDEDREKNLSFDLEARENAAGAVDTKVTRKRVTAMRLALGAEDKLSVSLPADMMATFWSTREPGDTRRCHISPVSGSVFILPADDPIVVALPGEALDFRFNGNNWYGRSKNCSDILPTVSSAARAAGRPLHAKKDFDVDFSPGRIIVTGFASSNREGLSGKHDGADPLKRSENLVAEAVSLISQAQVKSG